VTGRLFDDRFKSSAAGVYAYSPARIALGAIVFAFAGLASGWTAAAAWFVAAMALEVILVLTSRALAKADAPRPRHYWACFAAYVVAIPAWTVAGVILWSSESTAGQLAGAAFFASHMLYIQAHHAHSPTAALPSLPSLIAPAIVPLAIPRFAGTEQAIVAITMGAVVLHGLISMGVSLVKSKALQTAQQAIVSASRAKSEFLARMSHEIRNPLNGVLGMTQALAAEPGLAPGHRERLKVIEQSGQAVLEILNDVLDLSRVEAGKLEIEAIAFDLEALVEESQAAFAALATAKGLAFRSTFDPALRGMYRGDPTRLRQVLYNLLGNALKFTEAGEVSLRAEPAGALVRLTVSDSGVGIEPQQLAKLFAPFQQAEAATSRRYGGSGLGLSICRELCQLMGGEIEAQSQPGAGSRFSVTLPLERLEAPSPKAQAARPPPAAPPGPKLREPPPPSDSGALRVLAAEDNAVNQLVLRTLLSQIGVEPVIVGDGRQAVDAWKGGGFDVILMDVQMPVMDGLSAMRAIRAAEASERRPRIPILALTANAMQHQVAEYIAAGADGHVAKPIDARRLFDAIDQAVRAAPGRKSSAA
jgi:signal transduction histidine kinase/CheY-like chemotaxis protein